MPATLGEIGYPPARVWRVADVDLLWLGLLHGMGRIAVGQAAV